ncbi:MAG: arsenic resistance N-acetyltransferase ArsN2 [Candidatus Thorarchaeota archaeon]
MTWDFKIENAKESDHAAVVVLLQETDLPPDGIELHMENFLIIRHPEAVAGPEFLIGSVGLEIYEDSALLRSLAVHPDFQGKGLGSRLVNSIIDFAKGKGIHHLFLLTDTAEKFFEKRGWVVVTRDKIPEDMKQSVEFTTLCTSSPSMMKEI